MQAWINFIKLQEKKLGKATLEKWVNSLKIIKFDSRNLFLEANDSFQINWFNEHIKKDLIYFRNNNNQPIQVHLKLKGDLQNQKEKPKASSFFQVRQDPIDPDCTFSNLIMTEENLVPYSFFKQLYTKEVTYNPVYISGPSGSGKTHLLMALYQQYLEQKLSVFYINAKTFTEHVIYAIRQGHMKIFRGAYRNIDVLIIDDIHLLSNKKATQEEFFHTFNTLHTLCKQIVISASKPAYKLEDIEPRLISRFEWGLELSLEKINKQDSYKILKMKSQSLGLPLTDEIYEFLLTNFATLKNAIKALQAIALRSKENVFTLLSIKIILKDLLLKEQSNRLTPEKIISSTAKFHGLLYDDIIGKSQSKEFALPRQIAMHLCRNILKITYAKIGKLFAKDHSTVMSSIKKIEKEIEKNSENTCLAICSITELLERQ